MNKLIAAILLTLVLHSNISSVIGQTTVSETATEEKKDSIPPKNLRDFFRQGKFEGHGRYYFMATDNTNNLSDYYANAFGMGIGYETPMIKGFSFNLSGFFIYNLASSDLSIADPVTGQFNRYEIGLFDVQNPKNRHDLDRLEDLNIKYTFKKGNIKFGKQHINTPFINPQDGRMRPTLIEGLTAQFKLSNKLEFLGGWILGVSPRSTIKWFSVGESIGTYPVGRGTDGKPSAYAGNVKSHWISYGGIKFQPNENTNLQAWNMHVDNVSNTSLIQAERRFPIKKTNGLSFLTAIQGIYQTTAGNGGNSNILLTYSQPGSEVIIYGGKLALEKKKSLSIHANHTRIGGTGRYLMPREWGRDPLFTFMPRERNEGFGDVHAFNFVYTKIFGKSGLVSKIGYGEYYLPDVLNAELNKYAFPSYRQLNLELRYKPKGFMEGLEFLLLYVYKGRIGEVYDNPRFVFNKVDMSIYNFVMQYSF